MTDARAGTDARRRSSAATTLAAAAIGFFVLTLDTQVVTDAAPVIGAELDGGGVAALQWMAAVTP